MGEAYPPARPEWRYKTLIKWAIRMIDRKKETLKRWGYFLNEHIKQ
jgi:hypothetical protein